MSTPAREVDRNSDPVAAGRGELAAWEEAQPENYYETDRHLQSILEFHWGAERLGRHAERLSAFGRDLPLIDHAVREANLPENLPRLQRYSAIGDRIEEVIHSTHHDMAGFIIYGSGVMSVYGEPGNNLLALALFYLSSYNGEAGHNCPLACTAGVIKTLQFAGGEELRAKYLPSLLDSTTGTPFHGAQFLTEVQGGSDVGANAVAATPIDGDRKTWRLNGEKWFCSNVTADLALVTARPEGAMAGTKGLDLFLVPRLLDDGALNGLHIRRLKEKLGTKSMATAEVDFRDAFAYRIGEPGRGFQHVMDYVVNTSRIYNAVGSAGAARRACVVAWTYAGHRRAFGAALRDIPLVQETLAEMRAVTMAITSGSLHLAHLRDEIEAGRADEAARQFFRLAVNLNKYRSSMLATDVIRRGIEILGGNGAMENFSVLPRLLRDSIIFEAWEGAHNTLLAQSTRDLQRYRLHDAFCARLIDDFGAAGNDRGVAEVERLRGELDALLPFDERSAGVLFKPLADRMMWLYYLARLEQEAAWEERRNRTLGKRDVIEWLWRRFIDRSETPGKQDASKSLKQIAEISSLL
ncbi:MAG: acyl-CoA dehydrogenase family protein [Blastocatellia bacterium]